MLKITASALAAAVLVAGLGMSTADAAKKRKEKAKEYTAASCTASPNMRDDSKFHTCFPMQAKK